MRNDRVTGEPVSKSKDLHLGSADLSLFRYRRSVCKHKLDSIVEQLFRFECHSWFGRSCICCKHRDHWNCRIPLQHGFNLRVSGAYFPSLHLGPSRQLVDEGRETFILIALGAVAPAGG